MENSLLDLRLLRRRRRRRRHDVRTQGYHGHELGSGIQVNGRRRGGRCGMVRQWLLLFQMTIDRVHVPLGHLQGWEKELGTQPWIQDPTTRLITVVAVVAVVRIRRQGPDLLQQLQSMDDPQIR